MKVTMADIARRAKVSRGTVSRVLSGAYIRISDKKRKQIIDIANKLNYIPNRLAVSFRTGKTFTIAVITYDITDAFATNCINAMEAFLEKTPYRAQWVSCAHKTKSQWRDFFPEVCQHTDGIVILSATRHVDDEDILRTWYQQRVPTVLVLRSLSGNVVPSVVMNEEQGAEELVEYLISLGHKRIAFCYCSHNNEDIKTRYNTYKKVLKKHKIKVDESLQVVAESNAESGYRAGKKLIKLKKRPTAIIAYADIVAFGVITACSEAGLRIPQDISVAGFDNVRMAEFFNPPLTTSATDYQALARISLDTLLKLMEHPDTTDDNETSKIRVLDRKLIVRKSTGPVP